MENTNEMAPKPLAPHSRPSSAIKSSLEIGFRLSRAEPSFGVSIIELARRSGTVEWHPCSQLVLSIFNCR